MVLEKRKSFMQKSGTRRSLCRLRPRLLHVVLDVSGNNLAGLLVFKVLGAVALAVTIPFAVEALDSGLYLGRPRRTSNTFYSPSEAS
jgi:hypothetical protein